MSPTRIFGDFRDTLPPGHDLRPERRGLTPSEIARLIDADPGTHEGQGRIRAALHRVTDTSAAELATLRWLAAQPVRPASTPPRPNPARVADAASRPAEALGAADVAWVGMLDRARLSDADVTRLAELEASADDPGRRLIGAVLAPVRRRLDAEEERAELAAVIDAHPSTSANLHPDVVKTWTVLAGNRLAEARVAEIGPQLTGLARDARDGALAATAADARAEGAALVAEAVADVRGRTTAVVAEARARIAQLDARADPKTSAPPLRPTDPAAEAGRRRARAELVARRPVGLDPTGTFTRP